MSAITAAQLHPACCMSTSEWMRTVYISVADALQDRALASRTRALLRPPTPPPPPPPPAPRYVWPLVRWVRMGRVPRTTVRTWLRCVEVVTHPRGRVRLSQPSGG